MRWALQSNPCQQLNEKAEQMAPCLSAKKIKIIHKYPYIFSKYIVILFIVKKISRKQYKKNILMFNM